MTRLPGPMLLARLPATALLAACAPLSNARVLCDAAADAPLVQGDPCQEDALLPLCTGAGWAYEVTDWSTGAREPDKTWHLDGVGTNLLLSFPEVPTARTRRVAEAWSFCRSSSEEVRQAWLTADDRAVYWENTVWFSADGSSRKDTW